MREHPDVRRAFSRLFTAVEEHERARASLPPGVPTGTLHDWERYEDEVITAVLATREDR